MDQAVRFVGIANAMGSLLATAYRHGLKPLMNSEETAHYAMKAAIRAATRDDFEANLGETIYVLARYAKLVRVTIPIVLSHQQRYLLLISFDVDSDPEMILHQKILPYISEKKNTFP